VTDDPADRIAGKRGIKGQPLSSQWGGGQKKNPGWKCTILRQSVCRALTGEGRRKERTGRPPARTEKKNRVLKGKPPSFYSREKAETPSVIVSTGNEKNHPERRRNIEERKIQPRARNLPLSLLSNRKKGGKKDLSLTTEEARKKKKNPLKKRRGTGDSSGRARKKDFLHEDQRGELLLWSAGLEADTRSRESLRTL